MAWEQKKSEDFKVGGYPVKVIEASEGPMRLEAGPAKITIIGMMRGEEIISLDSSNERGLKDKKTIKWSVEFRGLLKEGETDRHPWGWFSAKGLNAPLLADFKMKPNGLHFKAIPGTHRLKFEEAGFNVDKEGYINMADAKKILDKMNDDKFSLPSCVFTESRLKGIIAYGPEINRAEKLADDLKNLLQNHPQVQKFLRER